MRKTPRKLYHYCSIDNFQKIIESKSIWLSNSSQMNDSKEATWIETYFDFVKSYFPENIYQDFTKYLFPTYGWNKLTPYIFCLSEVKDSLSQWRAYASDGKGVCIGFNIENLGIKLELPSTNVYRDETIGISQMVYSKIKQKKLIQKLTEDFKEMYDKKENELWSVASSFMALELVNYSLIFKNPSFTEEKEWRIIHTPLDNESRYEETENKIDISKAQFRTIHNRMTTYTILNLENNFDSNLISEIVLGPKSELDQEVIDTFLMSNNLKKTKITKSKSTYR